MAAAEAASAVRQLIERGQLQAALSLAKSTLPSLQGLPRGELLLQLAVAHSSAGEVLESLRCSVAAKELFKASQSAVGECDALMGMGNALRSAGDHASALSALEEAESMLRPQDEPSRRAIVLRSLGICASILGRHRQALSNLEEALALTLQHGSAADMLGVRMSLYNAHNRQAVDAGSASSAGAEQQPAALHRMLLEWRTLADDCAAAGQTVLELKARGNHGITLLDCGLLQEAVAELDPLLGRYLALGLRPNAAICHNALARAREALLQHGLACDHYRQALALLRDGGSLDDLQEALEGLSRSEEATGNLGAALAALREARAVDRRKSDVDARAAVAQRDLRIELARLTNQWARQASEDPLTGLGNRRALERWLDCKLPQVESGEWVSLLLMDLDHFKHINDRFGHDVGDAVLKRVAELIRQHCRAGDLAVRYGGEEFLLALSGMQPGDAAQVAERLRLSIGGHDWAQLRAGLSLTVSMGLTSASEASDATALLTLADQRLYAAKLRGRNQVVVA